MAKFKYLDKLYVHIDEAFKDFYNAMLNDIRLSVFFDNKQQIINLIEKQKKQFTASLQMEKELLKEVYIKLGEFHYDLRIPYVDFIKGAEILQEHFLLNTQKIEASPHLMDEIFEYFKLMRAYTSKGYLNRMISEDKKDIEEFFNYSTYKDNSNLPKAIVLEKVKWLGELLSCIENNLDYDIDSHNEVLNTWMGYLKFLSLEKKQFIENLQHRILINTQNLFYFLKREEYLEILPLYTSLLSVYKLTLMMNNAITLEYANKVIDDMKLDSLSQLYRKDLFEEILAKELSALGRIEGYKFSVVFIDLDDFKNINDTYGHYSGDKVIEKIGESIRKNIRASDFAFRIGGDEFALILKGTQKENAKKVASKIQADFSSYKFIFNDEINFSLTCSIGIIDQDNKSKSTVEMIHKEVDKKLYESKKSGKNKIS